MSVCDNWVLDSFRKWRQRNPNGKYSSFWDWWVSDAYTNEHGDMAAQAYIVIGEIAGHTGIFEHPAIQKALDYFSEGKYDENFLPWSIEDDRN